mmetsp:Transcript_68302/g.152457  ORF Transcript_68302/g.152457 Transcript_68302/m.152457 type:complete len:242 (+) Transcript_68302:610-1335(+)
MRCPDPKSTPLPPKENRSKGTTTARHNITQTEDDPPSEAELDSGLTRFDLVSTGAPFRAPPLTPPPLPTSLLCELSALTLMAERRFPEASRGRAPPPCPTPFLVGRLSVRGLSVIVAIASDASDPNLLDPSVPTLQLEADLSTRILSESSVDDSVITSELQLSDILIEPTTCAAALSLFTRLLVFGLRDARLSSLSSFTSAPVPAPSAEIAAILLAKFPTPAPTLQRRALLCCFSLRSSVL